MKLKRGHWKTLFCLTNQNNTTCYTQRPLAPVYLSHLFAWSTLWYLLEQQFSLWAALPLRETWNRSILVQNSRTACFGAPFHMQLLGAGFNKEGGPRFGNCLSTLTNLPWNQKTKFSNNLIYYFTTSQQLEKKKVPDLLLSQKWNMY